MDDMFEIEIPNFSNKEIEDLPTISELIEYLKELEISFITDGGYPKIIEESKSNNFFKK
ncbi:MAG: hypothetical protein LIO71_02595 [Ruminococcus sp.]|nr:hypothetical protein [Ruminococcus sp.]